MDSIYQGDVKGKVCRLTYQPNSNTKVQVSTPLGMSSMAVTGENIGQGSIPGALVSSLNLDLNVL